MNINFELLKDTDSEPMKLKNYINLCIKDACLSENRKYEPEKHKWFAIVIDNQLLFHYKCPYRRVIRKVKYRIFKNIKKNFNIEPDGCYSFTDIIDADYVCKHIIVDGIDLFVEKVIPYDEMDRGIVIPSGRYEKLCLAYHDISIQEFKESYEHNLTKVNKFYLPFNIKWEDYKKTYYKAFGVYPDSGICVSLCVSNNMVVSVE